VAASASTSALSPETRPPTSSTKDSSSPSATLVIFLAFQKYDRSSE